MSRFDELITTVEAYQALAAENYNRIRSLAEEMRAGLCDYIGAADGMCVHLVPPKGPFEPRPHGDQAFSLPPRGFRPLVPISFGLAVRVSKAEECRKVGEVFIIEIEDGAKFEFRLPLRDQDPEPFHAHVFSHVLNWFQENIERYEVGDYGTREIGFDFADDINAQPA